MSKATGPRAQCDSSVVAERRRVVAFSPGFVIKGAPQSKPRFYISHGTFDHIPPIASCGKRIALDLKLEGCVRFREFDGDHEIPADVAREALRWV